MVRTQDEANKVRFEGAVHYTELREEVLTFRQKWHIKHKDLAIIFDMPEATLDSIINDQKSIMVMKENADKIRQGIRHYDPRKCQYRRIPKAEVAEALRKIKRRHEMTWKEVGEVVGYPEPKIRQINSGPSDQRYVPINDFREMLINYNAWIKSRAQALDRDDRRVS